MLITINAIAGESDASGSRLVETTTPKLVVQITVDQLRGDLPMRFRERLGEGGFRYLLEQGTHFNNAHYRHANTETAVGHATLVTGADPSRHGMVSNYWFDPQTGESIYNTEDDRHHLIGKQAKPHQGVSPRNLLASTIGDELVLSNAGQSRVFSVSGKDRGAILPGGHAGKAFWYSKSSGSSSAAPTTMTNTRNGSRTGMRAIRPSVFAVSSGNCYSPAKTILPATSTIGITRLILEPWAEPFRMVMVTTSTPI